MLSTFNIGNSEVALNLVPVDFVVEAMSALARDPLAIGKTIQLADPEPLTTRELFNTIARCICGQGIASHCARSFGSHFADAAARRRRLPACRIPPFPISS